VVETLSADVRPDAVWDCLADACSYAQWVVGTVRIERADADWPAVGARLHHRFGPGLLRVRDETEVLECQWRRRLVLCAAARPWAVVRVDIVLVGEDQGVRIILREEIRGGLAARCGPAARGVQRWRNRRALRSLVALAEARMH
jgi:uncharacterized protein YndB with AHSA1/START domain